MFRPIEIVGAAAIGEHGTGWRSLGEAALVMTHGTHVKLPGIPADVPLAVPKSRKMMSRSAYLAARCLADLLADVSWRRGNVGYFLGVGASGGDEEEISFLLDASMLPEGFSLARFESDGLAACNPLLAFQLMNNFTLAHGAILEGLGGPNSALFSRGAGTTSALIEAAWAITDGDCEHAIAGGAESATYSFTRAELARDGFIARGMRPTEGAAMLALGAGATGARTLGVLESAIVVRSLADVPPVDADLVVIAPWGPPIAAELMTWAKRAHASRRPDVLVADVSLCLGDSLAASPGLAWCAAIDMLVAGHGSRALVINAGVDGDIGAVVIARGDA